MRENRGWYKEGLTHEQLVVGLRAYISHVQNVDLELQGHLPAERRQAIPAAAVIRRKLDWEAGTPDQEKGEVYSGLRDAWDALAYDRYRPGSRDENLAGFSLFRSYNNKRSEGVPDPDVIRLSDPLQVRMMDALAEAAYVPHERGQTAYIIPERLRDYTKWTLSEEYQNKVKAEAARARGDEPQASQQRKAAAETPHHTSRAQRPGAKESSTQVEQNPFYAAFWDKVVEQSSIVPSGEDPAFWPRSVFEKFEFDIASRDYLKDKARHELATKLMPIEDSIRRVRTAYEIAAYASIQQQPRKDMIAHELQRDREYGGRESVELTDAEQAIVRRLCETPRYAIGRGGKETLQPKIPFNPQRRIYNYTDVIGPATKDVPRIPHGK